VKNKKNLFLSMKIFYNFIYYLISIKVKKQTEMYIKFRLNKIDVALNFKKINFDSEYWVSNEFVIY